MSAREQFDEPRMVEVVDVQTNKQLVGKAFKAKAKEVQAALEALGEEDALCLQVPSPRASQPSFVSIDMLLQRCAIRQRVHCLGRLCSPGRSRQ